ncbi:DNA-binding response regulator, LuxR family protein [Minicystis rosea]|nr:DNA-binding response regulator, LuxR family protein [Minicystis rosea]
MIRVFLVDDHGIVRAGIRQLLSAAPDVEVVGEAGDGRKALEALERVPVDVLVLDLHLPRMNGIEILRRAIARSPGLAVLVLSMYADASYVRATLSAGAAGYLSKDASEEELLTAIRAVSQGRLYAPRDAAAPGRGAEPAAALHASFSAREHQIFTLLFQGRSVTEIAAELDLTVSTVSTHIGKIKVKLGVRNVAEIVGYAHRVGLAG